MKLLNILFALFVAVRATPMATPDTAAVTAAEVAANPVVTGTVTTSDGIQLRFTQSGPTKGKNILLVPGWRQTAAEWKKQVTYFSEAGYRVTAYDMRGHGESAKPTFGYRVNRFAADLNDLLTKLDLKDLSIIGHSMGVSVTWAWWDLYPAARSRVKQLVLVDQPTVLVIDPNWTDEQIAQLGPIFKPDAVYDTAADIKAQGPALLKSMFTSSVSEADYEWALSENLKMNDANAAALLKDHALLDWRDVLPRITVRTLVIAGEVSIFSATAIAAEAQQIPGAKSYTFTAEEKGSHFLFWENPDKFNKVVGDFLKS